MAFSEDFLETHQHPVNRACHGIGGLFFLAAAGKLLTGRWKGALVRAAAGAALIGIGHAVEGEPPAFLKRRAPKAKADSHPSE